jgi:hypothetical protein
MILSDVRFQPIELTFHVKDVGFNYWTMGKGKKRDGDSIGDRVFYSGARNHSKDIPFLKGRDVNKWYYTAPHNWLRHNYQDFLNPQVDTFRFTESFFKRSPKIIYRQTASTIIATLDNSGHFLDKTIHLIVSKHETWDIVSASFLLGLLNSKLFAYLYAYISQETKGRTFAQVKTTYIKQLPVPINKPPVSSAIAILVEYLLHIHALMIEDPTLHNHARDQLMKSYFGQLIDALVYELYLTEEIHQAGRKFFEPLMAERLLALDQIKGDKLTALRGIFERLFDRDHPIRQNIFFLDTIESVRIIEGKA